MLQYFFQSQFQLFNQQSKKREPRLHNTLKHTLSISFGDFRNKAHTGPLNKNWNAIFPHLWFTCDQLKPPDRSTSCPEFIIEQPEGVIDFWFFCLCGSFSCGMAKGRKQHNIVLIIITSPLLSCDRDGWSLIFIWWCYLNVINFRLGAVHKLRLHGGGREPGCLLIVQSRWEGV